MGMGQLERRPPPSAAAANFWGTLGASSIMENVAMSCMLNEKPAKGSFATSSRLVKPRMIESSGILGAGIAGAAGAAAPGLPPSCSATSACDDAAGGRGWCGRGDVGKVQREGSGHAVAVARAWSPSANILRMRSRCRRMRFSSSRLST